MAASNTDTGSSLKIYHYPACSTCKNALKYLRSEDIPFEAIHIVNQPPSLTELRHVFVSLKQQGGSLKSLFNTSGEVYKNLKLAEKFSELTEEQALKLLAENGKLIKRPFVCSKKFSTVGFKQELWDKNLRP